MNEHLLLRLYKTVERKKQSIRKSRTVKALKFTVIYRQLCQLALRQTCRGRLAKNEECAAVLVLELTRLGGASVNQIDYAASDGRTWALIAQ